MPEQKRIVFGLSNSQSKNKQNPAARIKKSSNLAALLIADRFSNSTTPKKYIQRNSVTEFTNLSMLNEKITVENKVIANSRNSFNGPSDIEMKYESLIESMDYSLTIPPRVEYSKVDAGEYKAVENVVFNRWKYMKGERIFERNVEIWRQFWITCERATTIAQIVDSRDPCAYFNRDIMLMYPGKNHVLLMNKTDLVKDIDQAIESLRTALGDARDMLQILPYSTKENSFDFNFSGTVGLIGYPNVGKSSTINMILRHKKVRVSSTPGKTKFIQTIETPTFTLLDCPGLVFPNHSKIQLVLMGILNVDQIPDLSKYEDEIIEAVGRDRLMVFYKLNEIKGDFLTEMSMQKGWMKNKCLKTIARDFSMGEINLKNPVI